MVNSAILALILTIILTPEIAILSPVVTDVAMVVFWAFTGMYLILTLFSIVYACVKLNQPGISREVRKLVLIRHVVTMVTFVLVNSYVIFGCMICLLPKYRTINTPEMNSATISGMKIIYQGQGLVLPITRITEPFFY